MTDAEISQFKLIARGGEAEIYDMGDDKVLRVLWKQSDRSYRSSETYGYLCPLLRQAHIDVPEIYEYTNVGERPAQIMQKIDGTTMLKQLARQPFQIPSRIKRLAELHNRMFSVKTDDCLKSIDDRLRYFVSKSPIADKELIDFVLRVYESLPSGNNLCHGDFHPGNILMQNGECYIIDWSGVYRGHFLSDVAHSFLLMKVVPKIPGQNSLSHSMMSAAGRRIANTYLKDILRLQSFDFSEFSKWTVVMSFLRVCYGLPAEKPERIRYIRKCYEMSTANIDPAQWHRHI